MFYLKHIITLLLNICCKVASPLWVIKYEYQKQEIVLFDIVYSRSQRVLWHSFKQVWTSNWLYFLRNFLSNQKHPRCKKGSQELK